MRSLFALLINSTFWVIAAALLWSLSRIRCSNKGSGDNWNIPLKILSDRRIAFYLLLGACLNISFAILTGYINPRDYVQDDIAARQFINHATMYPKDLPQTGIEELSQPIAGSEMLKRLPGIRKEFKTISDPPAYVNAHPPLLGILMSAPIAVFGLRGSFLFVSLLSGILMCLSLLVIIRELFGTRPRIELYCLAGLIFGWFPVSTALRGGQPSIAISFLITMSWLLLRRKKSLVAGAIIGLAACIHVFPALLTIYFAARCRRALVSAVAVVVLLSALVVSITVSHTFKEWFETVGIVSNYFVPKEGNL